MNMKDQFNKIMETLKTTAGKTATTFSVLENNLKDISQKIKADLQKAQEAKTSEVASPPPQDLTQSSTQQTTAVPAKEDENPKPQ